MTLARALRFLPPQLRDLIFVPRGRCWAWLGRKDRGYPRVFRAERAHRTVYELLVGAIPDGHELDHTCRNRGCVNPAHLEPVTPAENTRRNRVAFCDRGHRLAGRNVVVSGNRKRDGSRGRTCRTCRNARRRRLRALGRNA